jgi:hypothetical protein
MPPRWRRRILTLAVGIYLVAMGFVLGIVVERWRFDEARRAVLDRYNEVVRQVRSHQMKIEMEGERK